MAKGAVSSHQLRRLVTGSGATAVARRPKAEPGKTKISIRLDNRVLDHFRSVVKDAGGGNYQTLINDALVAYIQQKSILEAVRQVVREEVAGSSVARQGARKPRQARTRSAAAVA